MGERHKLLGGQIVEIGAGCNELFGYKLLNDSLAEAVDIHRGAGRKVFQMTHKLCGAGCVCAARRSLLLVAEYRRAADRTEFRHDKRGAVRTSRGQIDARKLGDDVARLADEDHIAHADVLRRDVILIVQRCAGNQRARDRDRIKHRIRRQNAGTADADEDIQKLCAFFLRRIFECHRPARRLRGFAEDRARGNRVDLYDRTVDIERQRAAQRP